MMLKRSDDMTQFQSTHPSGVRPGDLVVLRLVTQFQSTHPSGVRLDAAREPFALRHISIHAPQWGATRRWASRPLRKNYFNPRTPVGCDDVPAAKTLRSCLHFNPRTPVGCDTIGELYQPWIAKFQSTHPSGVRPHDRGPQTTIHPEFQSTHPSGVRLGFK